MLGADIVFWVKKFKTFDAAPKYVSVTRLGIQGAAFHHLGLTISMKMVNYQNEDPNPTRGEKLWVWYISPNHSW